MASKLKAVPTPDTEPLTYEQIESLTRSIAIDLTEVPTTRTMLMLLMDDIAQHPFDHSNVETIANLLNGYMLMYSPEGDAAFRRFMDEERGKLK